MNNTNQTLYNCSSDSEMRKFLRPLIEQLLHASIYIDDVMEELESFDQELSKSEPRKKSEDAFLVICLGPNQSPQLDFYNMSLIKLLDTIEIEEELTTGLMMAYQKEELVPSVDGHHYLIGPVILFDCDEDGNVISVTAEDYDAVKTFYSRATEPLAIRNVSIPAIKVNLAGAPFQHKLGIIR